MKSECEKKLKTGERLTAPGFCHAKVQMQNIRRRILDSECKTGNAIWEMEERRTKDSGRYR